jgi:hypothetical protein
MFCHEARAAGLILTKLQIGGPSTPASVFFKISIMQYQELTLKNLKFRSNNRENKKCARISILHLYFLTVLLL